MTKGQILKHDFTKGDLRLYDANVTKPILRIRMGLGISVNMILIVKKPIVNIQLGIGINMNMILMIMKYI